MKNAASGALGAVAGLAVAGVVCYVASLPKPEDPEPTRILTPCPVESYKVKFTTDTTDASKIVVDKETVGTAYKGDIVKCNTIYFGWRTSPSGIGFRTGPTAFGPWSPARAN